MLRNSLPGSLRVLIGAASVSALAVLAPALNQPPSRGRQDPEEPTSMGSATVER
jgi:hypothetical protein